MTRYPFPTNLFRVFPRPAITEISHTPDGKPTVMCVKTDTSGDCAVALALLRACNAEQSFVLLNGLRSSPDGLVTRYEPGVAPSYAGELRLAFDMEWVELGPRPQIHLFTHTEEEWQMARQAMYHLLRLGRLSTQSYLESDHTGQDQGWLALDLNGAPHSPKMVELIREAAICRQNALYEERYVALYEEREA